MLVYVFFKVKYVFTKAKKEWAKCHFYSINVLFICSSLTAHSLMANYNLKKILVIDDFHPVFCETLKSNQFEINYLPEILAIDVINIAKEYPIIACRSKINFKKEVLEQLPNLRCIARGGAGMDNIDEEYANFINIKLLNAPEGNRNAVAEHALGILLNLSKNISSSFEEVKNYRWNREQNRGFEIDGKTIGVIGYGNTGKAFVKKLMGFDCEILVHDNQFDIEANHNYRNSSLSEIQEKADIISLHIPLNKNNKHYVNESFITKFAKNFVLINTSRGKVVKTEAILQGLDSKKLIGFGSDVLENEKLDQLDKNQKDLFNNLFTRKNVVITPHVAGWTKESYYKIGEILASKLVEFSDKIKKNEDEC